MNRFSFNHGTAKYWPLPDMLEGCAAAGVRSVGVWREPVAEVGLAQSVKLLRDNGLTASSLCRGGFFGSDDWLSDNRAAIDEAAELGAPALILVCGGLTGRSLTEARNRVAAGIEALVPYALDAGVRLAVEPLHPMLCSARSVVASLAGALDLVALFPPAAVGIALDTYHVWWDERLWELIAAAGDRIACVQLADWLWPLPADIQAGRGLPGTGCIDFGRFLAAVADAGFTDPIEVEVFNADLWARPGTDILQDTIAAYLNCASGHSASTLEPDRR